MLFNSIEYAVFLPIVFIIYWLIPNRIRWALLLVCSYYFYMSWNAKYVILILFTTGLSYFCAIMMERVKEKKKKKWILTTALVVCLGILFVFKYYDFFIGEAAEFLNQFAIPLHPMTLKLVLPVGISFYTFQTLSYVIDVYKGTAAAEHHFGKYAAFISFFPQLVAGPIERTENLLPQICGVHRFSYEKAAYGLKRIAWGYFKKIVIADTLATYVDVVFENVTMYQGFSLAIATVFFTIQIYCDFSGYSDIALGSAKLLDIDLMENFKSPYFASSIKGFWQRWHISLSTWFRDYIYFPLGGNRGGGIRTGINTMIVFLISGLWHGANTTFILWGGVHGIAQIIEGHFPNAKKEKRGINWLLSVVLVFLFCSFAWIFFRAATVADAFYVMKNMFYGLASPIQYLRSGFGDIGIYTIMELAKILFIIVMLMIYDFASLKEDVIIRIGKMPLIVRWAFYLILGMMIILLSQKGVAAEFVYFQF